MRLGSGLAWLPVAIAGLIAMLLFMAYQPALPLEPGTYAPKFEGAVVAKGAELAAIGNCIACHTLPGGHAFAGGVGLPTPFGTIYSTNITPDAQTGIGRWSKDSFCRAMTRGIGRKGQHLYPAFPYEHFTKISDDDCHALYAFLMTRQAVSAPAKANDLVFPFQFRPLLAGWKMLFFSRGALTVDRSRSDAWNRGRYLSEGLGHCGSCHTPRNAFGAEISDRHYAGGEAEGWVAYPLDATNPAPVRWTDKSLAFYLRNGWDSAHGVARGPMSEVTGNLSQLPDNDIVAIASYIVSLMGTSPVPRPESTAPMTHAVDAGARIYAAACASCHESRAAQPYGGLDFRLSSAVNAENPQNIINVTLFGLPPADGESSAIMPPFGAVLTDDEIADLLSFLRRHYSGRQTWPQLSSRIARTRSGDHVVAVRPADGIERSPRNVGAQ